MEFESLSKCSEVIRLFESLEQNRLYAEKEQLGKVVEHIDDLTSTIRKMQEELKQMRQKADGAEIPIVEEAQEAVAGAKGILDRVKETIRDTAANAVRAGREAGKSALVATLHAARIPALLEGLQKTFHETELRMRRSARKAEVVSNELHVANVHFGNVERVINGKALRQPTPVERKGTLYIVRAGFIGLANTFERLSLATAKLREKIPALNKRKAPDRESVRGRIQGIKQQSAPTEEHQTSEIEI